MMASAGRRQGENREAKRKRRRRKKNKSKQAAAGGEANTSIYENQQRQDETDHSRKSQTKQEKDIRNQDQMKQEKDIRNQDQTKQEEDIRNQDPFQSGATATTTTFWRDPEAESCCICGDDDDGVHSELNCPYYYLSPVSYVPCRARLTIWNDEVFKPYQTFGRFSKPTKQDRIFARRRESLRRVVRVTNLPASRSASAARRLITGLFAQFGPLRMYHVAMRGGGGGGEEEDDGDGDDDVCVGGGGIGCVVFERREDAEKAIDELNCYVIDGHSLRVDWVYPYCGK